MTYKAIMMPLFICLCNFVRLVFPTVAYRLSRSARHRGRATPRRRPPQSTAGVASTATTPSPPPLPPPASPLLFTPSGRSERPTFGCQLHGSAVGGQARERRRGASGGGLVRGCARGARHEQQQQQQPRHAGRGCAVCRTWGCAATAPAAPGVAQLSDKIEDYDVLERCRAGKIKEGQSAQPVCFVLYLLSLLLFFFFLA